MHNVLEAFEELLSWKDHKVVKATKLILEAIKCDKNVSIESKDNDLVIKIPKKSCDAFAIESGRHQIMKIDTKTFFINFCAPIAASALVLKPSKKCEKSFIDSRLGDTEFNIKEDDCDALVFQTKDKCKCEEQAYLVFDTKCKRLIVPEGITFEAQEGIVSNESIYLGDPEDEGTWRFQVDDDGNMNLEVKGATGWNVVQKWIKK